MRVRMALYVWNATDGAGQRWGAVACMDSVFPIQMDCINALHLSMLRSLEREEEAALELIPRAVHTMTRLVISHTPHPYAIGRAAAFP